MNHEIIKVGNINSFLQQTAEIGDPQNSMIAEKAWPQSKSTKFLTEIQIRFEHRNSAL